MRVAILLTDYTPKFALYNGCLMKPAPTWTECSDEALLTWRICDLDLTISGTELEPIIAQFYDELRAHGLTFQPPCYLADEWFCAEGVPAIAIPFYLAHPRLRKLEAHMVLEVEGGTREECLRLLRHEAGHALMYAYRLNRKRRFRALFGSSALPYKETYRPRPYSKGFVLHLDNWYAQSHPDEDFAETFAVWLDPGSAWRERYRGWRALQKLEYVDHLMQTIAGDTPLVDSAKRPCATAQLTRKLKTHYQHKRRAYAQDYPDFYDSDLQRLFHSGPSTEVEPAARFMHRHRRLIVSAVARWTGGKKYDLTELMTRLTGRCRALRLMVPRASSSATMEVAAYLTSLIMNYLHTGKFKRTR